MLRLIALIVVSLYAAAPSFATPARLSLPNSANSILLEVQAHKPSGELQRKYREHGGTYNDKPTSVWIETPKMTPTIMPKEHVDLPENDLRKENKETDGRPKGTACPNKGNVLSDYCHSPNDRILRRSSD